MLHRIAVLALVSVTLIAGSCGTPSAPDESALCADGKKDGSETAIDCGGGVCPPCVTGMACIVGTDCASGVCTASACVAPMCMDGVKNGGETDIDCGGSCPTACPNGQGCAIAGDCQSGVCKLNTCQIPSCNDEVKNANETDVDCGGTCPGCAAGKACAVPTDCLSPNVCLAQQCDPPSCADGMKDGNETDVDCGGGPCPACAIGKACGVGTDCQTGVCAGMSCQAATCSDGVKNGGETGIDCGGGTCPACAAGQGCSVSSDCQSLVCSANLCAASICTDGVKNGIETDVDCGGDTCAACADGKACLVGADCIDKICTASKCAAPTCSDGVKNGKETDIDCGGGSCAACATGKGCGANGDCASGLCKGGKCTNAISCLTLLTANPAATTGVYEIDPDGPGAGLAPFPVYCDMTTSGGGWTVLPLLFNNPSYWAITHPGNSCITIDTQDNNGNYRQYFSSNTGNFSQTYMEFIPPIPVSTVQLVNFVYTNSGSQNTMDFVVNGLPGAADTSYEAWYFVNAALSPIGFPFSTQAQCVAQGNGGGNYQYITGSPAYCSRDALGPSIPVALYSISETIPLSMTVPNFNMGLIQGCGSSLGSPATTGEQFHIATPPNTNGVWQAGIEVR